MLLMGVVAFYFFLSVHLLFSFASQFFFRVVESDHPERIVGLLVAFSPAKESVEFAELGTRIGDRHRTWKRTGDNNHRRCRGQSYRAGDREHRKGIAEKGIEVILEVVST